MATNWPCRCVYALLRKPPNGAQFPALKAATLAGWALGYAQVQPPNSCVVAALLLFMGS